MKSILLNTAVISALTISPIIYAHDKHCNVEIDGAMDISKNAIVFYRDDKIAYEIRHQNQLLVNGQNQSLNASQQALVSDFASRIHGMVPKVKNIALEGITLAQEGVNKAFTQLLGADNTVTEDLDKSLAKLRQKVEHKFNHDQHFYINKDGVENDDFLGEEFEQELEASVEKVVKNSIGSIMIAVGKQMLTGNGDNFEQKMENFGESIEAEMEAKAEKLEKKAEKLCIAAVEIDKIENQMQRQIPQLKGFNIIQAHHQSDEI